MTEPFDLYSAGRSAADEVLAEVFGIRKASNPLDQKDFLATITRVGLSLSKATALAEKAAATRMANRLDADWVNLSEAQREDRIGQAGAELDKAPDKFMPGVDVIIKTTTEEIVPETRKRMVSTHRLKIRTATSARDEAVVKHVRENTSFYVRDQYGRVRDTLSERARRIVAEGLAKGLGSAEISEDLATMTGAAVRPRSYWNLISTTFCNRARVFTQIHSLDDAALEEYRWDSVLDEVTSNVCRYMHGRVFSVAEATKRFRRVMTAKDPTSVEKLMPWVQEAVDENGRQVMFYTDAKGAKRIVATIDASAVGRPDARGKFSRGMSVGQLERAGIVCPPAHGHCRSTIVPA